ncbi:UDP-N-acetylglucosamine--LPS N-acetylglucosamine transferase [Bacillus sp. BRMEA1]|uniref:MGDG synthase family glycosyltransferase n=1 Tax=Neobacillus endophyticus TaxID=2738405 RepID=UPI00156337EC|nr:glycosyltransferase [Neobacillus endophyticus]NRD76820.1 UDP-N-acetylglucosamine--LPS N-acetylglucosamine transferase [Neobacillus endophyticus]
MEKKLLIISSDHTGHGHKSITESLCERAKAYSGLTIHVVDGFSLGNRLLLNIGKSYGPITRNAESLWKMIWKLSAIKPSLVDHFIESLIRDDFLELLAEVKPDLILSVHPNFNGSILNILEKHMIKIPFVTLIADLVNIFPLWADKRANYIISPTLEAQDKCREFGIPHEKIQVSGFPVRSRFFRKNDTQQKWYRKGQSLTFLIMSGGEGAGNMKKIAETLLSHFDCTVKIVAGKNKKLKNKLERSLKHQYGERVMIYGFTHNIQDLMLSSDIAFTRGSPNVMFEAIASNTPLIITGALPGQEEDNPAFAENFNLGVVCKNQKDIKHTITQLLENDGEKLHRMMTCQRKFVNANAAEDILQFILNVGESDSEKAKVKLL